MYGAYGVIGFGRFNEEEQFVILVNNNDYEVNVQVSVWQLGVLPGRALVRMLYTNTQGFGVDMALYYPEDGILSMRLWPFTASRMIAGFNPSFAACGPLVAVRPTLWFVLVIKREWSWLESSFIATINDWVWKRVI